MVVGPGGGGGARPRRRGAVAEGLPPLAAGGDGGGGVQGGVGGDDGVHDWLCQRRLHGPLRCIRYYDDGEEKPPKLVPYTALLSVFRHTSPPDSL